MSTTVATSLSKLYKLSTFPRRKSLWPEPEVSIDTWYRSMGSCECWEAIGQARDVFIALSKEIKDLLERRSDYLSKGESIPHSITFGIYMIGRTKESANPTIIFSCREASPRQRAREIIQESGILDKHPGIRVGDTTYPPEFDQAPRLLASDDMIIRTTGIGEVKKTILCYSSNNLYGRQIFLRGYDGNGASLRKATAGGIFVSQGRFFYQTVAHAFTKTIEYAEYIDDPSFKFDIDSNGSDTDEGNKLMDTSRESLTSSCSDLDETKLSEEPWSSVSLQDQNRLRNSGRIYNETDNTTVETGPLPPDFESRIWHHDNAGEPYIVLGDLFMSSLGRPCASLDWALIEIKDLAFLRAYEEHLLSTDTNKPFESPKRIGNLGSDNVHILAMTGSSGLLSGTLSGSPTFKTSPGCHTFQEVWTVRLEGNISNGDCGSWVIDARTGDLYGYIISGDLSSGVAHIVPAFQAVESMKQCLGNDVKLLTKRHLRAKQGNIQLNEHVTFGGGRPSFLFRIDRLEPTFASQAPQLDFYPWSLPLRGDQYNRWPGILYRWREGFVTPVLQHEPMPTLTLDSSSPLCYSSASILSEHPNGAQCLAVDFDVTKKTEFDHWCSPAFHHIPFQGQEHFKYSYLDFTAEYGYLAAPDQSSDKWMSNLFPDEFQYHPQNASDPVPTSAGVAGRLSLLLAFAAFSCREEHLDYVLRTSLRPFKWIPHGFKPSLKSGHRGMMVSVFIDPAGSTTFDELRLLEDERYGPFFAPELLDLPKHQPELPLPSSTQQLPRASNLAVPQPTQLLKTVGSPSSPLASRKSKIHSRVIEEVDDQWRGAPSAKKGRTNIPWTPVEEKTLKNMRDAGNNWSEIAKALPTRTEGSIKKHWYKDMHYADFSENDSAALLDAVREYDASKWKVIGQKVGKPAKACEQYAREHFGNRP